MSKLIIDYDLSVQPAMDRDTRIRSKAIVPKIDALLDKIEGGGDAA